MRTKWHIGRRSAFALAFALVCFGGAAPAIADINSAPDDTYVVNGFVDAVARTPSTIYLGGSFTQVGPNTGSWGVVSPSTGAIDTSWPQASGGLGTLVSLPDGSGGYYIGGAFTIVGGVARNGLAHILANGTVDPAFNPDVTGTGALTAVETMALSPDGSTLYLAGLFSSVNGSVTRNNAAAVSTANGTVTAWDPNLAVNPGVGIETLAVSPDGSTVYLGGEFTTVNGSVTRNNAAAVDATTGTATPWDAGVNDIVNTIALSADGSTVYVGGDFDDVDGTTPRNYAAAFPAVASAGPTGTTAQTWDPNLNDVVQRIVPDGSTVYLAGEFTTVNNGAVSRTGAAAVDATSASASSWNPDITNGASTAQMETIAVSGSTVYLGGFFTTVNGASRHNAAAVDATTGATVNGWDPAPNQAVATIDPSGSSVAIGGPFNSLGGVTRNGLAALSAADGSVTPFNPGVVGGPGTSVDAVALSPDDSTLYFGGSFSRVNGSLTRTDVAAADTATGAATAWDPEPNNEVLSLATSPDGSTVYLGGEFTGLTGPSGPTGATGRSGAAAVDAIDGTPTSWNPDLTGVNFAAQALAVSPDGSIVYLGGGFSHVGVAARQALAAVDATTGAATSWNPNTGPGVTAETIKAIALSGSTVYVGGGIASTYGSDVRTNAAAFDASTGAVTPWNPAPDGIVDALAASGSTIFIGGQFHHVGSTARTGLAQVDASAGAPTAWNPNLLQGGTVNALAADGAGGVTVGGFMVGLGFQESGLLSFSDPPSAVAPVITDRTDPSGTPAVGDTLTCAAAVNGSPVVSSSYQWLSDGTAIGGATAATYTVASADAGHALSCTVTESDLGGSASGTSPAVSVPAPPNSGGGGGTGGGGGSGGGGTGGGVGSGGGTGGGSGGGTGGGSGGGGGAGGSGGANAPVVSKWKLSRSRFPARTGATLTLTLSEAATVKITISERVKGRVVHKRCKAGARKGKRCLLTVTRGTITRAGKLGANKLAFTAPRLAPGHYTATIVATDSSGHASKPAPLSFTITRPVRHKHKHR